jgi:hypothetical protein
MSHSAIAIAVFCLPTLFVETVPLALGAVAS